MVSSKEKKNTPPKEYAKKKKKTPREAESRHSSPRANKIIKLVVVRMATRSSPATVEQRKGLEL